MTTMCNATPKPRRAATPRHSPSHSKRSVRPVCAAAIVLLATALTSCGSFRKEPLVLSADRRVIAVPCMQHPGSTRCYEVTDGWMAERYQQERTMRLTIERLTREQERTP